MRVASTKTREKTSLISMIDRGFLRNESLIDKLEAEYLENERRKDIEIQKERDEIRKNFTKSK